MIIISHSNLISKEHWLEISDPLDFILISFKMCKSQLMILTTNFEDPPRISRDVSYNALCIPPPPQQREMYMGSVPKVIP